MPTADTNSRPPRLPYYERNGLRISTILTSDPSTDDRTGTATMIIEFEDVEMVALTEPTVPPSGECYAWDTMQLRRMTLQACEQVKAGDNKAAADAARAALHVIRARFDDAEARGM